MLQPFSFVLLRSPLQSLRNSYNITAELTNIFQEGLYLSSPDFFKEFQKKDHLKDKEKEKIELSFTKYWLRSSVRCTPYGTFAGSSLINIKNEETKLVLSHNESHRRSLRLDMNYMTEIVNALVLLPEVRKQLIFVPNNSMYPAPNVYRYAEYNIKNNKRNYQLTAVDKSPYLEKILIRAKQGATMQTLISMLVEDGDGDEVEASEYVTELWRSQLLIPTIEPSVTGIEPLDQIILQLEQLNGINEILIKLKEIQYLLNNPQEGVEFYKGIEIKLEQLALGITVPKNTVQADLFLNTEAANINSDLISSIVKQVEDLKIFARQNKNPELEDFKTKFNKRYEEKEMPLALVLDADLGIGYAGVNDQGAGAGEFIDGLPLAQAGNATTAGSLDYLQKFSLLKYDDWLTNHKSFIEISEEEINMLRGNTSNFEFSNSMYLKGALMKSNGKLDKDNFMFEVDAFGGPSGANLLGRFAHGDERLSQLTKEILEQEEKEKPDAMYAEVAHLPQARVGNILLRPVLRKYEIPYVGFSGIRTEQQITIDDLFISVRHNEILLFSKELNKRVIPRLTTAHNYGNNSLPFYKFLCDLQSQGLAFPNAWSWGHLATLKHLPRVIYKNLILKKAIWKIDKKDIIDLPKDITHYSNYFKSFCTKLKMPARVVYVEGDNELLIDFEEQKGIELFLHYLNRNKNISLEEYLFTEENCVISDKEGNPFTNELIIPLYDDTVKPIEIKNQHHLLPEINNLVIRTFSPYSSWLYFKIYSGSKSIEKLLARNMLSFIEESIEQKTFEKFFFIRYRDETGGHLRIRFFNNVIEKQLPLYQKFMQVLQPLIEDNTIEKVMLDSYNRELERYTPELIEETETLFYHDSLAVLRFINLLDGIDGEKYRMLFALRGIDSMLDDFNLTMEQKNILIKRMQASFFREFGGNVRLQKQLNDRYRKYQSFFTSHFKTEKDEENEIENAVEVFNIRSEMNRAVIGTILDHLKTKENEEKVYDLLTSYIHMYINRLYFAQQRKYELVAYHFLERYYNSRIAIAKKEMKHGLPVF